MTTSTQPLRGAIYARQSRGKTKSVNEQVTACTADVVAQGYEVVGVFTDLVSASRYGVRQRGDHGRLLAEIAGGALGLVATWSPDRADRTLTTWSAFLDACRARGVLIRITDHERTYDMGNPRDWRQLAEDGIDAAYFSEKLSRAVTRGVRGAAESGRPPMGPCPYGYRRVYAPETGRLTGQEPDPTTAPTVRRIFEDVTRGVPLSSITEDLNTSGVAPPGTGKRWYRQRVRLVALNPSYAGLRRHNGTTHEASWEPLVSAETFYSAVRILSESGRFRTARPGRQVHLLTYLGTCFRGHPLTARGAVYVCTKGCVHVARAPLDELVEAVTVEALADPRVYRHLRQASDSTDREVLAARDEVARLNARLREWRVSAARGKTTPASLAVVEAELAGQITAATKVAATAGVPAGMRELLEPSADVEARWEAATLGARRDLIRSLMTVTVHGVGQRSGVPVAERVSLERVNL
jgi:DNA invertase Pin-like site-specific DNA recombinase